MLPGPDKKGKKSKEDGGDARQYADLADEHHPPARIMQAFFRISCDVIGAVWHRLPGCVRDLAGELDTSVLGQMAAHLASNIDSKR